MTKIRITNMREVIAGIPKRIELIDNRVIEEMERIGEKAVTDARINADFRNWTNNLRSSFAYAIYDRGKKVRENFELRGSGTDGDGTEGLNKAKKLVADLAKQHRDTVVLIVVAAERYAGWVEAKGYSVLTKEAIEAGQELSKELKKIPIWQIM